MVDVMTTGEIGKWVLWLRAAGRPETTIGLRLYHVRRVLSEVDVDPRHVSTEQLVNYLAEREWGAETRRSCRASLRNYFDWMQATGRRTDNPAALMPSIRLPRGVARPIPDAIYRQALIDADDRVALMIQLAAICGLRRGEIARLRREHVHPDLEGHSLFVQGKGGHERTVPLPADLARELLEKDPGWIFPSSTHSGPIGAVYLGKLVSDALPEGWTCHTLRHRCATVAYAATRDLRAVQELLGHAKPETTMRYTHVPQQSIRAAMSAAASTGSSVRPVA